MRQDYPPRWYSKAPVAADIKAGSDGIVSELDTHLDVGAKSSRPSCGKHVEHPKVLPCPYKGEMTSPLHQDYCFAKCSRNSLINSTAAKS